MTTQIKNIVFDIGQVLLDYSPDDILRQLLPDSTHHDLYKAHLFNAPIWLELDKGTLSNEDAIKKLSEPLSIIPNYETEVASLLTNFVFHLPLMERSFQLFQSLKATYNMYILSNFQARPFSEIRELHPFILQVNGVVISSLVHLLKPDPLIYEYLLSKYNLIPDETIFIDDKLENITAATAQGIHGIQFKSADQVKESLRQLGVKY